MRKQPLPFPFFPLKFVTTFTIILICIICNLFSQSLLAQQSICQELIKEATAYYKKDTDKMLAAAQQALVECQACCGKNSCKYGEASDLYGSASTEKGKYLEAKEYHEQAVELLSIDSCNQQAFAAALSNLAFANSKLGFHKEALPLVSRAIDLHQDALNNFNDSLNMGISLMNRGNFYGNLYQLGKKIEDLKEALKYFEACNHTVLINLIYRRLGNTNKSIGNYQEALEILQKAKDILESDPSAPKRFIGFSISSIGVVYEVMEEYDKALTYYIEAEKKVRMDKESYHTRDHASSFIHIANAYKYLNQKENAKNYFDSAEVVLKLCIKDWNNSRDVKLLHFLNSKATYHNHFKEYDEALILINEVVEKTERFYGKDSRQYGEYAYNIGVQYDLLNEPEKALPYFLINNKMLNKNIENAFGTLSETEKTFFLNTLEKFLNNFKFFTFKNVRNNNEMPIALKQLYNNELSVKGILLEDKKSLLASLKKGASEDLTSVYVQWNENRKIIAALSGNPRPTVKVDLDSLIKVNTSIERKLVLSSDFFKQSRQSVKWMDVRDNLAPDEAAIEFTSIKHSSKDSTYLCALLIRPSYEFPKLIPLFEEREIQLFFQMEAETGDTYAEIINTIYDADWGAYKNLYNLVWQPLDPFLSNVNKVFYSPGGVLHKVSFASLPISKDSFLIDKYNLQLGVSTREVIFKNKSEIPLISSATFFGDVDFNNKIEEPQNQDKKDNSILRGLINCKLLKKGTTINALPGSTKEIKFLQNLFKENNIKSVDVKKGEYASEYSFKRLGVEKTSPSILHISTHGFFFEPSDLNALDCIDSVDTGWEAIITSKSPLLRSGLLLSGASTTFQSNQSLINNDNGILTSMDIASVDLSNTQLAVLSACETGLGDISETEGVYGLQRAFKMAGVDQLLMTLWKVDDETTNLFMQSFYTNLLKGTPPEKALRLAQNEIRKDNPSPFYWAGFILL